MSHPSKTKLGNPVPDVEKAQAYYRDVLGFEIAWTLEDKSMGAAGREDIAIFFLKQTQITPTHHWIFAEDIDATYQEMKTRKANITDDIENKPWDLRQFTIEDPNGHRFTFHHDLEPSSK
jgi:catechol 2,3-dioxygenase-like lactoylglutathione lyase family enzyme